MFLSQNSWLSFSPAARWPDWFPAEAAPEDEGLRSSSPCSEDRASLHLVLYTLELQEENSEVPCRCVTATTRDLRGKCLPVLLQRTDVLSEETQE